MTNCNSSLLKVRVYPSLDFTLGQHFPPRPDKKESATEIKEAPTPFWYGSTKKYEISTDEKLNQEAVEQITKGEKLSTEKVTELLHAYETEYLEATESGNQDRADSAIAKIERLSTCPSLLGLSVASISHKPERKQRGINGITSFGKRMVRSSLAIMERKYTRDCLTLGTCTLPAMTDDEFQTICGNWSEVVRQFFQELTRELIRKGLNKDYVQVTEIQERRFTTYGDVGLHLHWVIQGRASRLGGWAFHPTEIREIWNRILSNMLKRDVIDQATTRIEKPRTSLCQEMGKYLSKGVAIIQAVIKAGKQHLIPSAWWGAAKPLKTQVKSEIIEVSGLAALWLDRQLRQFNPDRHIWHVDIYIEKDGREFRAGAVGRFNSQKEVEELKSMHEILSIQDGYSILELFS